MPSDATILNLDCDIACIHSGFSKKIKFCTGRLKSLPYNYSSGSFPCTVYDDLSTMHTGLLVDDSIYCSSMISTENGGSINVGLLLIIPMPSC